ncbi:MAG: hypothetical protein R3F12_15195 [Lysobacteraceae bacterium]
MNISALLLLAALSTGEYASSEIMQHSEQENDGCAPKQPELAPINRDRTALGRHTPSEEKPAILEQGRTGIAVFHVKLTADGSPAEVTLSCATMSAYFIRSAKRFVERSTFDSTKRTGDVAVRFNLDIGGSSNSPPQPEADN